MERFQTKDIRFTANLEPEDVGHFSSELLNQLIDYQTVAKASNRPFFQL